MSSLIPHDYRYKISSPTPVDKEPFLLYMTFYISLYSEQKNIPKDVNNHIGWPPDGNRTHECRSHNPMR